MKTRCGWVTNDPLYLAYHDSEWGVPEYDDRKLFELLILEGAQAGLSWLTVLKKRENYRKAFMDFEAHKIATFADEQVTALLANPGIVRNRLKLAATIQNARAFLAVQKEYGRFATYLWQFVGGKPKTNAWQTLKEVPARTVESDAMSKALAQRGCKVVGSTICYALMQAAGMVNDHTVDCFRYEEIKRKA
ncbi:MAG TPA: DNA-3-methyladenine glycosylase I [Candidatus Binatia bacterium]|nr:DNA-3-methyladenine glycosylase I [Candidatus Binatia bacterium]